MQIIIPTYCKIRAAMRGVTQEQLEETLRNPDIIESAKEGRMIAKKKFMNDVVCIVFKERENKRIAITVYWRQYL